MTVQTIAAKIVVENAAAGTYQDIDPSTGLPWASVEAAQAWETAHDAAVAANQTILANLSAAVATVHAALSALSLTDKALEAYDEASGMPRLMREQFAALPTATTALTSKETAAAALRTTRATHASALAAAQAALDALPKP